MKILCIAIVAFTLITVCQPAPLTCEELMKPVDQGPDITGTWYLVAMATDSCLLSVVLDQLNSSSISMEITPMAKSNFFLSNMTFKIFGYCHEDEDTMFYNGTELSDDETGDGDEVMLTTGCPDCFVVKDKVTDSVSTISLISRRKTVTAEEMKEFDKQAECHGLTKPRTFVTEDGEKCKYLTDEETLSKDLTKLFVNGVEMVNSMFSDYSQCILRTHCSKRLS